MANERMWLGGPPTLKQVLRRRYWREADARVALDAVEASGSSVADFAAQHGVDPRRLSRWQRQLGRGAGAPARLDDSFAFLPVRVREELPPAPVSAVELVVGRYVLRVTSGFEAEVVSQLIDVLEGRVG
jgi:transposase-like protein